jgi:hypothetical protein
MGKIILTETQYKRFKNILVDSVINEGFINESSKTNQHSNTLIFEENNPQILSEGEFVTTQFNKLYKGGKLLFGLAKGVKFKPSEKLVGYAIAKPNNIYDAVGIGEWSIKPGEQVTYNCSSGKFSIGGSNSKNYNSSGLYNTDLSEALKKVCAESMSRNIVQPKQDDQANKPEASQQKTPEKVYTMVRGTYNVKSDDGETYTIPDGTRYVYNADKKGASFKLDKNKFGWFGCQSKIFLVDNVKYKDAKGYLANNIVKAICGGEPETGKQETGKQEYQTRDISSRTNQVVGQGGGGSSEYSEYV